MKIFKDNSGREWKISITVEAVKRVRSLCGINLLDVIKIEEKKVTADLLDQLATDPVLLVDVIFCICRPQADELNVSDVEFGESMTGDTVEAATAALMEELINFFPEAKKKILRLILDTGSRIKRQALLTVDKLLASPELEEAISKLENDVSKPSITSPGSAE